LVVIYLSLKVAGVFCVLG